MSNQYKEQINKNYTDMGRTILSNEINNSSYYSTGNYQSLVYDAETYRSNRSQHVNNSIESLYPKTFTCSPSTLSIEMTREVITAMNANMKIKDIEILVPNKVVKVVFDDNTFEKAICHEDDKFDLEIAITVCIAKHLLGGSAKYNNIVEKGVKVLVNKIKAEEEAKREKERIEAKRKKNYEKKMKKIAKKEKEARDARILEQAEAIKLANEMMRTEAK